MTNLKTNLHTLWRLLQHFLPTWPASRWGRRTATIILVLLAVSLGTMYGIARWYMWSVRSTPQVIGASFIPSYAQNFGLDPGQTLQAMLGDLHIKHLRLVSYWDEIEPQQGIYNFDELDREFMLANQYGAKVTLSIGLRQPRWPECHPPNWVDTSRPREQWQPQLEAYMTKIIDRYGNNSALQGYQVENEYFLKTFGECQNFDRQRLVDEVALVKKLDPKHPIIITRSNNGLGIPLKAPKGDYYGVSVYKRVWDASLTHRYVEYPQPAWYYAFMAGVQKIVQGRDMNVHELQAEAWAPNGQQLTQISLAEQNKSLDASRLQGRFEYGRATGLRTVDMWGAEYWYYRQQVLHDPSLWQIAERQYREQ